MRKLYVVYDLRMYPIESQILPKKNEEEKPFEKNGDSVHVCSL